MINPLLIATNGYISLLGRMPLGMALRGWINTARRVLKAVRVFQYKL